jgi:hypothetical protein
MGDWLDTRRQGHIFDKLAAHLLHPCPSKGITGNSHVLLIGWVLPLLPEVVAEVLLESDLNDHFILPLHT